MKKMEPSVTGMIYTKADAMRAKGIEVFHFAAGDPVLPHHPAVISAAKAALENGSPYAPVAGLFELRKEAANWMHRRYGAKYEIAQTIVTCGGKFAIYAALKALLEEGDEALIIAPYWVSYPEMVRLSGGKSVVIHTAEETGWKLTPAMLKREVTSRTRVLILNNPCNPTGIVYTKQELQKLLEAAAEANLFVIADEVYSELVYEGKFVSCCAFPEHISRVIVIESCSKNFAMAGWRVGFAFGPAEIVAQMIALQSQTTTGTSLIAQKAALAALEHAEEITAKVRAEMNRRRKLFFDVYNRLFEKKEKSVAAAIYCFAKIEGKSAEFCEKMLSKAHVALVPGVGFGQEGYVRFAFSGSLEEIERGLKALANFL